MIPFLESKLKNKKLTKSTLNKNFIIYQNLSNEIIILIFKDFSIRLRTDKKTYFH